mgnify:CR=1 FL=1
MVVGTPLKQLLQERRFEPLKPVWLSKGLSPLSGLQMGVRSSALVREQQMR